MLAGGGGLPIGRSLWYSVPVDLITPAVLRGSTPLNTKYGGGRPEDGRWVIHRVYTGHPPRPHMYLLPTTHLPIGAKNKSSTTFA